MGARAFGWPAELPIVGAPLAGGPSTPTLAAAVCEAGGVGFVAAGYRSAPEVAGDIDAVRAATDHPFGVNVFYPAKVESDDRAIAAYAERLADEAQRYGVQLGEPRWSDDDWDAKLELVAREQPAVVSFTFGCPDRETISWLRNRRIAVWCTITTPAEARVAVSAAPTRSSSREPRRAGTRAPSTTRARRRSRCCRC